MLKALELTGFKSFADKTRFEFPEGITVIVGPNGSGKSNIVDGIKWVLGEQSAKSLRGKDMSDVIFKGSSGPDARRPANSAQATLVLDNSDRRFAFDADEVLVSRRVYRSGETEYLINDETTRLKDIKSLFRGTGVGTDAYSLIEQGKVERLLQTNAKDRRAIFEEAAGISRFKANKVEAQRRLARVEGNLIRLADIVEEVGSRYRSVKSQASRAARYKEYSDRLQQLRTYVGMKDWRSLSEKIAAIESEQQTNNQTSSELSEQINVHDARLKEINRQLDSISSDLMDKQEAAAKVREQLSESESLVKLNQSRLDDLGERAEPLQNQLQRAMARADELKQRSEQTTQQSETAELEFRDTSQRLTSLQSELDNLDQQIDRARSEAEERRAKHAELLSLISQVGRLVSAGDSQAETAVAEKDRYTTDIRNLTESLEAANATLKEHEAEKQRLQQQAESRDSALAEARATFDRHRSELNQLRESLQNLNRQHSGLEQRADVIEELEKSLEGINAGARELLQRADENADGPLADVIGLVADLVAVNVQHANLVDVALGDLSQYVVVDGGRLIGSLADGSIKVNGRVGLIQLDEPPALGADPDASLNGQSGVIGRADRLVQVQPQHTSFIRQLLGGTWVVKTLGDALHLHGNHPQGRSVRYVTLDGEVVEADGTVVVGPKSANIGLVSRRSELRALRRELARIEEVIADKQSQVAKLTELESQADSEVQKLIGENTELASRLADHSLRADAVQSQIAETGTRLQHAQAGLTATDDRLIQLTQKLETDRQTLVAHETAASEISQLLGGSDSESRSAETRRTEVERQATAAKVKLAKSEQQLADLNSRLAEDRAELTQQLESVQQYQQQTQTDADARVAAENAIEAASQSINELNRQREQLADDLEKLTHQRTDIDARRKNLSLELTGYRDQLRLTQDKIHQATLRLEQLTMQRSQMAERLQEDYGIDVSTVDETETNLSEEELHQRESLDEEIATLRKRIGDIGSVNLESLAELEELEVRYTQMESQYQDLVNSKQTLEKIITRIDADSRKLFVETLEAIRQNFQKLFRQTFGGGHADVVLEEGVDPLEAGVEIIATPPGKPEFNNSLLSGGEKALTAVSLLMAIFQFRPSPFCVLDEVDAPFDEANIGRFIDVLRSFLGWTRFVIVTHSKKTMTAATTLYGITMQESGVSKRVSVRFEDVGEDGQISSDAIKRTENEDAA